MIKKFLENQEGATAIEYGLIAALVATVLVGSFTSLGSAITETYDSSAEAFPDG